MDDLLNLIGNVGFPIAVSIYLLIRVESQLSNLTTAIGELREAIITMPSERFWQSATISPPINRKDETSAAN
jgi:hypothetical protein